MLNGIRYCVFRVLCVLFLIVFMPSCGYALEIWASSPWLAQMIGFIAGVHGKVHSVRTWDDQGRMVRSSSPRGVAVALDRNEANEAGIGKYKGTRLLFERPLPLGGARSETAYFDPAVLPFVGQKVLSFLAKEDPDNYPYYQRRLAEFQSRLESTMEVGRQLLKGVEVLDLTGSMGPWIGAAVSRSARPPLDLWRDWSRGARGDLLSVALGSAKQKGWLVVMDPWTPGPISSAVQATGIRMIKLSPPRGGGDIFLYYYDLYLEIWNLLRKQT